MEDSEIELDENKSIRYIDYDKQSRIIYTNFFFTDINYVLKIPIASLSKEIISKEFKFEIFDLLKYKCLAFYKTISNSHHD